MLSASPVLGALRLSLIPTLSLASPSDLSSFFTCTPFQRFNPKTVHPATHPHSSFSFNPLLPTFGYPRYKGTASCSNRSGAESAREILVQHLLVKEDDVKLLLERQQRISGGEDLSDLAVEYSMCPSKREGRMLGWVRKGKMIWHWDKIQFPS